ncbi:MAG: helix-turn-helix transcriptional regulator [Phascolarctobacterium sp.]|nr:helix-turn-helix transcriptional regulator [Candidatus Phascolarctobacterium caballi]
MTDFVIRDNLARLMELKRAEKGLSMAAMAKLVGMDESMYKRIIYQQTTKISALMLYNVCLSLGLDAYDIYGINTVNLESIRTYYRKLSQRQRNYINSLIEFEASLNNKDDANGFLSVLIPTGNMDDGMILDSANVEIIDAPNELRRFPNVSCGIRITSNHLHPVYNLDDILLVSCGSPRHGDTGIFVNKADGRAYIRKYFEGATATLEPVNGHGVTFSVDKSTRANWVKFGYVVSKLR